MQTRRYWITTLAATAGLSLLHMSAAAQVASPTIRPLPSPNAPDPHAPAGLDRPPMGGSGNTGTNPQVALQLRSDVQRLFQMASDLKQQVEATDLNSVLSLGIVKRAQQIEKLAKQIREHAKG